MAEQMIRPSLQPGFLPVQVQSRDGTFDPVETARLNAQNVLFGTAQGQDPTFLGGLTNDLYAQFGDKETASTIRAAQRANELEAAKQEVPPAVNRDPVEALYEAASRNEGTPELQRPWSPDSLSPEDRELYDFYVDIRGDEPSPTWADGSPRNPMPDVRDALYGAYVREFGEPSPTWVDGTPRNPFPQIREWLRGRQREKEDPEALPTVNKGHGGIAGLAARGRHGDSMLVHMAPEEVAGLASLTENGITINPDTGLPEMFNLRDILPTIVGIGASFTPLGPLAAAALTGLTTAAVTEGDAGEKIGKGLLAGIGSWGMGKLGSLIGGTGAQTGGKLAGTANFEGAGTIGETLLTPGGEAAYTWSQLPTQAPDAFKMLSRAGVTDKAVYDQTMQQMGARLRAGMPTGSQIAAADVVPLQISGTGITGGMSVPADRLTNLPVKPSLASKPTYEGFSWQHGRPFREVAASEVLNPMLAPSDAALAYSGANPLEKLGYMRKGLGNIDMAWKSTAPGRLGLGDLATPAMATMAGIPAFIPTEEYEVPGRRTYDDQGPYFPEERRRTELPFGYIPGVSPQQSYFAAGGTRGKTVYAQDGYDVGVSNPTDPTPGSAAAAAAAAGADNQGGSRGYSFTDVPPPEMHSIERDVMAAREAEQAQQSFRTLAANPSLRGLANYARGMFDFGVPQAQMNEKGEVSIVSAPNVPGGLASLASLAAPPGLSSFATMPLTSAAKAAGYSPSVTSLLDLDEKEEEPYDQLDQYDEYQALSANQEGTQGMVLGDTVEESIDVETAAEIPPGAAATTGIMQGTPVEVQDDVEVRLQQREVEEPQNPRERAIYDRAVLALQNELEPEVAQRAIDEFLEVFGPDALHMLQEMVRGDRETGGIVETASGETTVEEGDIQGPDVIAGKIVDPVTGEETANLRVGENEYIEPADSLVRRAKVAGLPPTPENGAMIRGEEERMLRQAVG
jgi:hypothetical protein